MRQAPTSRVIELRPKDESVEAIKLALQEIDAEISLLNEQEQVLKAERGRAMASGSVKEIDATGAAYRETLDLRSAVETLKAHVAPTLAVAVKRETIAALQVQYEALDYEGKSSQFFDFYTDEYPALAAAIAAGMQMEVDALAVFRQARQIREQLAKLGAIDEPVGLHSPTHLAVGRMNNFIHLSAVVRLPGILGAPFIPVEDHIEHVKVVNEFPDWNSTLIDTGKGPRPSKTHFVESTQEVPTRVALREDTPIWPPRHQDWVPPSRP